MARKDQVLTEDARKADIVANRAQLRRASIVMRLLSVVVIISFGIVLGRVVQLQRFPSDPLRAAIDAPISTRTSLAGRGDLLDREGRVIASSKVGYRIFVDPADADDLDNLPIELGELIGVEPAALDRPIQERLLRRPDTRYVVVVEDAAPDQVEAIRHSRMRGVGLEPKLVRKYPWDLVARALAGKVGRDIRGTNRAEYTYWDRLQGQNGSIRYLRDSPGRPLWVHPEGFKAALDGQSVQLSIDLSIQEFVESRLREAVKQHAAFGGRLVAVDPRTGEIIALYDWRNPDFDRGAPDKHANDPPWMQKISCATDPYEPGSTFKPFVWALATEWKKAAPEEVLPTPPGPWVTPYGRRINDSHPKPKSTWRLTLVKSLNTGMAMVAERMTKAQMQEVIRRFGFGEETNCGIAGETAGIVTSPAKWTNYTQSSVSFGHEISVSTLQLVRGFCAFARDGSLPALRTTRTADDGSTGYQYDRRACKPETAMLMRDVLRQVMNEGTGRHAQSDRYQLFGKSGTAELAENGMIHRDRYRSSFIAGAPYDDPKIVVLCVLDDPDREIGEHTGGRTAGPVVRDVIDEVLTYWGTPADRGLLVDQGRSSP